MSAKDKALKAAGEIASHKAILEIDYKKGIGKNIMSSDKGVSTKLAEVSNKLNEKVTNFIDTPGKLTPYIDGAKESLGLETRGLKDGVIQVQYNPARIKYHASTSEKTSEKKDMLEGKAVKINTITNTSTVTMSFTLVFHSKYPTDQSVREQMELITSMIYNSPTRKTKFSWANMRIEGKMVSFTGVYDMFDMTGTPTSGHMDITIQAVNSVQEIHKILDHLDEEHNDKAAEEQ